MAIVYNGRKFSVDLGVHRFPDGRQFELEVVRHPPSVVLLPILSDGQVMLISQYRASIGRRLWELPAGRVNEGESAEDAAARECEEEIRLVPRTLERIRGLFPAPGFCDEELIFFRASDLDVPPPDSPRHPDEDEDIEARPFPIDRARAMVSEGEIVDLKTAYGLTLL